MMFWHIVTSSVYRAGTPTEGDMYFISDTREIYRGSELFTESVTLYETLPTVSIAINRLYIDKNTLEGKIYDGSKWTTVIKPVETTFNAESENPVTAKAIAGYVADQIANVTGSGDVVTEVTWDEANAILSVKKGSSATETIVFDGLGVTLTYDAATGALQLADVSGNKIGDPISLDLERFVTAGEYDAENKNIILYFDADKTESVSIPVGVLVDTYTAESSQTLDLTVSNNKFVGNVKISTAEGNLITVNEDGIYVAPIDISGKMDKVAGAVEGDIAVLNADGNVVDSGKKFEDLVPNNKVYEGATLDEAIAGVTPIKGDVAIVSSPIGETGKVQKTVHQYDGEKWNAFDSDYDASKVFLSSDWITTTKIGQIQTLTGGQAVVAPAGTDVATALMKLTAKEEQPTVSDPAVSWANSSASEFKAYEVGEIVPISVTAALSAGSYSYGRIDADGKYETATSAGIAATGYTFTDTNGVERTGSNTAVFDDVEVTDGINYKVTASVTYDGSAYKPATNFKNLSSKSAIAAGSKSATTGAITGYRNCFYGTLTEKDSVLTSSIIRGLTATGKAVAKGTTLSLSVPAGIMRAIVAYPASATTLTALSSVKDANDSNAEISSSFEMTQIDVEGKNGYTAVAYKVFVKTWASGNGKANTYAITI